MPVELVGNRIYPGDGVPMHGNGFVYRLINQPGAYGFDGAQWWGCTPNGLGANLMSHHVTEHEDKTITVFPSIFVDQGREPNWHGFLVRGNWQDEPP